MSFIEVKKIEKIYRGQGIETPALGGVSFNIEKGEFIAIKGPSGSGKSTLLHILGFLDRQTNGEYQFEGKTIDNYSKEEIAAIRNKKMGFIFQAFNLLARTTVLENVKLPLLYSDASESKWNEFALKAIEAVGLAHRLNHESSRLSGGEKQRAAIARALVNSPHLIFADEPTGNLDSKSGQIVMDILRRLNEKEGCTIVLITHESYTAQYARRIIELRDGEIESDEIVSNRNKIGEEFIK